MKARVMLSTLVALGLALAIAPSVHAQATRTWVSGVGDDANPGSRTAPCKTFAGAYSRTAPGGEISVYDPGGYGTLTISRALTINGDGTLASIFSSGTNGIIVNAGPNDIVTIRNISINGGGTGLNGIRFLAGKQLIIDNCKISGCTGIGIDLALASPAVVVIKNTTISGGSVGVFLNTAGAASYVTMDNMTISLCATGIYAPLGIGQIDHSTITQCSNSGLYANGGTLSCSNSLLTFNGTAVKSQPNSIIRLSNDDILDNTTGISISGTGKVFSDGHNRNAGNATPGAPNGAITVQ